MNKMVYWVDGDTQNAIELNEWDVERAADLLGVDVGAVNACSPGEMKSYGVALKDDHFQATPGL